MQSHLSDSVFGDLSYEYGWVKDFSLLFLGKTHALRLAVPCVEGGAIEASQREAFQNFNRRMAVLLKEAEAALFAYYQEICEEKRSQFGQQFADQWAPHISKPEDLNHLVRPTELIFQESFGSADRIVGLLLDCAWDQSLGVAIKFLNEEVSAVGPQDIVL